MKKIYLDTNIFVCSFSGAESNVIQCDQVKKVFGIISILKDVELWSSYWAITELVKVLIKKIGMDPLKVAEIETNLVNERRLHGLKIKFADVSNESNYDFNEFFHHIRQNILKYDAGVPDAIHGIIMKIMI